MVSQTKKTLKGKMWWQSKYNNATLGMYGGSEDALCHFTMDGEVLLSVLNPRLLAHSPPSTNSVSPTTIVLWLSNKQMLLLGSAGLPSHLTTVGKSERQINPLVALRVMASIALRGTCSHL